MSVGLVFVTELYITSVTYCRMLCSRDICYRPCVHPSVHHTPVLYQNG